MQGDRVPLPFPKRFPLALPATDGSAQRIVDNCAVENGGLTGDESVERMLRGAPGAAVAFSARALAGEGEGMPSLPTDRAALAGLRRISENLPSAKAGLQRLSAALNRAQAADSLNPETAAKLAVLLRSNVEDKYGDGKFSNLQMCGKTGTAQIDNAKSHSWFVGYSQREDLPLAVVCIAEHGGQGSGVASSVSNKVMQYFLSE